MPGSSSCRRRQRGDAGPAPQHIPCPGLARRSAARPRGDTMQPSEELSQISAVLCLGTSIYRLPIAMLIFALIISSCPSSTARPGSSKDTCPSELLLATLQFAGVQLHDMSSKDVSQTVPRSQITEDGNFYPPQPGEEEKQSAPLVMALGDTAPSQTKATPLPLPSQGPVMPAGPFTHCPAHSACSPPSLTSPT